MENWWDDDDGRKSKNSEKSLSPCHSLRFKSTVNWPGFNWAFAREAGDKPPAPWHGPNEDVNVI